jgi:hypothetical protein
MFKRLLDRFRDFMIGIDQRRAIIASRLLVFLMAILHIGGGIILLDTDYTRGTPLVIEQYGFLSIRMFSVWMLAMGLLMLPFVFGPQVNLNTSGLIVLSSPFIVYICYTIYGVEVGLISGQGAFLYIVLCAIVFVSHWGLQK